MTELTRLEVIDQIHKIDEADDLRVEQIKKLHQHRWYEETLRDPVHHSLMTPYTYLYMSADEKWGKCWAKKWKLSAEDAEIVG